MPRSSARLNTVESNEVILGPWTHRARCRGEDPELWFQPELPSSASDTRAAKAVCAACPVAEQCRGYIDELEGPNPQYWWGIWAGETVTDRRRRRAGFPPLEEAPEEQGPRRKAEILVAMKAVRAGDMEYAEYRELLQRYPEEWIA